MVRELREQRRQVEAVVVEHTEQAATTTDQQLLSETQEMKDVAGYVDPDIQDAVDEEIRMRSAAASVSVGVRHSESGSAC